MQVRTKALISGTFNAWKVAEPTDPVATIKEREVLLKIQGDTKNGFHLVMGPEGCFTADTWHATVEEAKDTALRLFDVHPKAWSANN